MFDLIIQNGLVADGSGNPAFYGDIAVKNGKIAAIGADLRGAERIIDAKGLVVTPGFIDCHSHADLDILFGAQGNNLVEQGITTAICGQCGLFPAPAYAGQYDNESRVPVNTDKNIFEICHDYKSFTQQVNRLPLPFNVAFYAGQGAIRGKVIGFSDRKATDNELKIMESYVRQAMELGFIGISTGLIYPPSWCADRDELIALSRVVAEFGGNYVTHIRSEKDGVIEAVAEAIAIGEGANCRVVISHHKVGGKNNLGKSRQTIELIEQANARGVFVRADQYPYLAGSTGLIATIPNEYTTDGLPELINRLKNADFRRKVTATLQLPETESTFKSSGFDGCLVLTADKSPQWVGKNLAEIAEIRGIDPYNAVYDLLVQNNGEVGMAFFFINEWDMMNIIRHPYIMCGTDAGAYMTAHSPSEIAGGHPRATATFPKHLKIVRDNKLFTMEKAIFRITLQAAQVAGLEDVGEIAVGKNADLCVVDWDSIQDNADFIHPYAKNQGIEYVIINGQIAVEKGAATGSASGIMLKHKHC